MDIVDRSSHIFVRHSRLGRNRDLSSGAADPGEVVTTDGTVLIPEGQILDGQNVWQAMGGMQVGSIWGHGSYVAPDWTADYLHREALFILNEWTGGQYGKDGSSLSSEQQAVASQRLQDLMRRTLTTRLPSG